jgi:hypothetical protein
MSIKIVKDFIPVSLQHDIEHVLLDSNSKFSWEYINEVSQWGQDHSQLANYGFAHVVYNHEYGGETSQYFKVFSPMVYFIEEKFQIPVQKLLRIRIGMQTLLTSKKTIVHTPHVDYKTEHKTLIYYVNTSDGDTIIYDEKFIDDSKLPEKFTIKKSIQPIKGSAVLLNGLQFHSSSSPSITNRRIVVNINFL